MVQRRYQLCFICEVEHRKCDQRGRWLLYPLSWRDAQTQRCECPSSGKGQRQRSHARAHEKARRIDESSYNENGESGCGAS